jgi:hypothetical protein
MIDNHQMCSSPLLWLNYSLNVIKKMWEAQVVVVHMLFLDY